MQEESQKPPAKINASVAAIDLINEYNINPSEVSGTGAGGKIIKKDIEQYLQSMVREEEE